MADARYGSGLVPGGAGAGPLPSLEALGALSREMGSERWRLCSDVAQVVASYLACHPRVARVRYPGLREDALYGRASCELVGGFGPIVCYEDAATGEWHTLDLTDEADARAVIARLG